MSSKKKLLFRVDANSKIGWGHFYRCLALAQMLKEDFSISFAMASPPDDIHDLVEKQNIECTALPEQNYTTPDERNGNELEFDLDNYLEGIDIVVLDGYWFGRKYQQALRKFSIKIAVIEDFGKGEYWADMVINHAPGISPDGYVLHSEKPNLAIGPQYALLRSVFLKAARGECQLKRQVKSALVCFGGSDYFNLTEKIVILLLQNSNVIVHAIIGAGYRFLSQLESLKSTYNERLQISLNLGPEEMHGAMQSADFGIVPASGILFECIASRLPVISGYYSENQESNYNGFLSMNAMIGSIKFDEEIIKDIINNLNLKFLNEIQINQSTTIDGLSARRYKRIFKCLN